MDEKFSVLFWTEFQVGELKFQVTLGQDKIRQIGKTRSIQNWQQLKFQVGLGWIM